jgi:hypothetical protein
LDILLGVDHVPQVAASSQEREEEPSEISLHLRYQGEEVDAKVSKTQDHY